MKTPMSKGYHPEIDDTPLCTGKDSAKYSSIDGCCIWINCLRRFDIAYATFDKRFGAFMTFFKITIQKCSFNINT
jgi:hypothetical protein